jgi:hypothetical protein
MDVTMRSRVSIMPRIATLLFCFAAWIPSAQAKDDYFNVPREQVIAQTHRVGILPMEFEEDWPRNAQAAQEFESLAAAQLAKAQIAVVPSTAYAEIETRLKREQGGWFNAMTGRVISDKRQKIQELARQEFVRANELDAMLRLRADVIKTAVIGTKAIWHGHDEPARLPTGRNALVQGFLDNSAPTSGNLPGVSIAAILCDKNGKDLYGRYGALQLLTMIREGKDFEFAPVDEQFVFADPLRNERAIKNAMQSLVLTSKEIKAVEAQERTRRTEVRKTQKSGDGLRDDEGRLLAEVVVSGDSPATAALPSPLRVPTAEIAALGKIIAMAPVSMAVARNIRERAPTVEAALTKALTDVGFTVVPSSVYREAYIRNDETMGPYFDPVTGDEIPGKIQALDAKVSEDLRSSHQVVAILHPAVVTVTALQDDGGKVRWDGVEQSIAQSKNALAKFNASTNMAMSTVPALSILVRLVGVDQRELFIKRTGVQTLRKMNVLRVGDVPDAELLADAETINTAVTAVVDELKGTSR